MKKWEITKSDYVTDKLWLTVRKDSLKLPNGKTIPEYYVLEYPDIATVIAVTKDKKFVLVRQYRHGIQDITTELCSGTAKPYENPKETAKRELAEETGYGNGHWIENGKLAVHPIALTNYTHNFIAEDVELITSPQLEDNENIEVLLWDVDDLKENLQRGDIIQPAQACVLWKYLYEHHL